MKKFFSLVLALVMALSLTTVAWGASVDETALKTAAANGGSVTLDQNITLTETLNIAAGKSVTIDLNGYTISQEKACTAHYEMITVKGTLTIKDSVGGGKISFKDTGAGDPSFGWGSYTVRNNGGTLVVDGGTIEHLGEQNPGNGQPNVHMYCAIDQYTGSTTINGGTISTPTYRSARLWMGDMTINGGTFIGQLWVQNMRNGTKLTINGGTFTPAGNDSSAVYIGNGSQTVDLTITDGTFNGKVGCADASALAGSISGGTFATLPDESLLADGKQLLANGTVVDTPAAGAVAPTLYVWDTAAKDWATYYIATGDDLDDLKLGADENCLPCYFIDGRYFVDTTEAAATYKLVYGATKLFLAPVDVTDVRYLDKATVFTNVTKETDECGKLVVTDTTKTYYVAYDEDNYDEDYYFVATKNGPIQLLVGGKIVDVAPNGAQDLTAHVWKGYDVVNNAYTTAKCENCGKVVKLYATGTAAGKSAHYEAGLGYITKIDNGFGPAVVTPSTDKVQSAETFDAGIAMYVGMSVMAAAGSVVVLKKRED